MRKRFLSLPDLRAMLSARGMLVRAALVVATFVVCHALGFRAYTSVLSGTAAVAGMHHTVLGAVGLFYVLLYIGAVVLAPILVIAAILQLAWQRVQR